MKQLYRWNDLEIVEENGRYFVIYDAGAHQVVWRRDEVTEAQARCAMAGSDAATALLFQIQHALEASGVDPYVSNYEKKS